MYTPIKEKTPYLHTDTYKYIYLKWKKAAGEEDPEGECLYIYQLTTAKEYTQVEKYIRKGSISNGRHAKKWQEKSERERGMTVRFEVADSHC